MAYRNPLTLLTLYTRLLGLVILILYQSKPADCLERCAARASPRKSLCQYGTLPGRWLKGDLGEGWNVYDSECQLQNLLGGVSPPEQDERKLGGEAGILAFGDSIDRHMLEDICANQETGVNEWMTVTDFSFCRCAALAANEAPQALSEGMACCTPSS